MHKIYLFNNLYNIAGDSFLYRANNQNFSISELLRLPCYFLFATNLKIFIISFFFILLLINIAELYISKNEKAFINFFSKDSSSNLFNKFYKVKFILRSKFNALVTSFVAFLIYLGYYFFFFSTFPAYTPVSIYS